MLKLKSIKTAKVTQSALGADNDCPTLQSLKRLTRRFNVSAQVGIIHRPYSVLLPHLALGDEDASERVEAHRGSVARLTQPTLQVEHGDTRAEELRDVMQQQQPVPQGHDGDLLQVVVLHGDLEHSTQAVRASARSSFTAPCWRSGYLSRQLPGVGGLAGGPGEGVSRSAGHPVDLLALKRGHQPRPLDGVGGPVSQLPLVVVPPCVDFS